MTMFIEQSAAAQTAYAGLAQAGRQRDLTRSIADLPGGFARKSVKGRDYLYHQHRRPDGKLQQIYVGPDDEETRALIAQHSDMGARQAKKHLADSCEAVMALGGDGVIPKHARVIARLADHGLFRAGGILVGTHAYLAYQNRFGVLWRAADTTVDLDFLHPGRNISLALSHDLEIDAHKAIESLKMGFLPINEGTRYIKDDEPDFDLDFLTCLHRRSQEPVTMRCLNLTLQPLKFMEFSMEDPVVAVLPTSSGPIVVNVPRPERYALAKLVLYMERMEGRNPEKASKDLMQAASLIDYLSSRLPDTLQDAWSDLLSRGPGWRKRARQGFEALTQRHPDIDCAIAWPDSPTRKQWRESPTPVGRRASDPT